MINQEIKSKWLEALRSGKYQQFRGALQSGDMYCCLGVLCDVVNPDGWKINCTGRTHKDQLFLPDKMFLENCGIKWDDAVYLSKLNDKGESFSYIADRIEALM